MNMDLLQQQNNSFSKAPIDVAIIRFDDGAVKVTKGNEFLQEF